MDRLALQKRRAEGIHRCLNGETLQAVATDLGVSRQAISQWLIEAGEPQQDRRRARAEQRRSFAKAEQTIRKLKRSERQRQAAENLIQIANEYGVTPSTISQWATVSGPYFYAAERRPRSDARLPHRFSSEGEELAQRVYEACDPLGPRRVSNLIYIWLSEASVVAAQEGN